MTVVTAIPKVYIDVTSAFGAYASTWIDITAYAKSVDCGYGRSRGVDDFQPGQGQVVLDNRDGRFDPSDSTGPWYGQLGLRNRIKVEIELYEDGVLTFGSAIGYGFVESWPQAWRYRDLVDVNVTWTDALGVLANTKLPASVWDWQIGQMILDGHVVGWYRWGDEQATVTDYSGRASHGRYVVASGFDLPETAATAPPAVIKAGMNAFKSGNANLSGKSVIPMADRPGLDIGSMIATAGQPAELPVNGDIRYPCAVLGPTTNLWGTGDFSCEIWVVPRAVFQMDAAGVNTIARAPEYLFCWGTPESQSAGFGIGTDGKPGVAAAHWGYYGETYLHWKYLADTDNPPLTDSRVDITADAQPHHLVWTVYNNSASSRWDITMYCDGVEVATYQWLWSDTAVGFFHPAIVGRQHSPATNDFVDLFDSSTTFDPHWTTTTNTSLASAPGVKLTQNGSNFELSTNPTFDHVEHFVRFNIEVNMAVGYEMRAGTDLLHFKFANESVSGGSEQRIYIVDAIDGSRPVPLDLLVWTSGAADQWYQVRTDGEYAYWEWAIGSAGTPTEQLKWQQLHKQRLWIDDPSIDYTQSQIYFQGASPANSLGVAYTKIRAVEFGQSSLGVGAGSPVGDAVVYDKVLTAGEVEANYWSGKYGNPTAAAEPDATTAITNAFGYIGFAGEALSINPDSLAPIAAGKLGGQGIIEYVREICRGEAALFWADDAGVIEVYGRAWYAGWTDMFTISDDGASYPSTYTGFTLGIVDTVFVYDDSLLTNSVSVSYDGGTQKVDNLTSQAIYGTYERSISTKLTNPVDAATLGTYNAYVNGTPAMTLESVTFEVLSSEEAMYLIRDDMVAVPQRCRVVRHRPNGTTLDASFLIMGVHHHIEPGNGQWLCTLSLVPVAAGSGLIGTATIGGTDVVGF